MKKSFLSLSLAVLLGVLASCSTKVDLYADYKDIPVIYGLIDATADTNVIKIVRAFSGSDEASIDATQVALIPDSCNYPGKLDARIVEYKNVYGNNYQPTGRELVLDTMTIHNKQEGAFYYPNQKVYFTTGRFNENTSAVRYKYKLHVLKGNDTISAETGIVGGEDFSIITSMVIFSAEPSDKTSRVTFKPADNAVVYDVKMQFNYQENRNGQIANKDVHWSFGTKSIEDLNYEDGSYYLKYGENMLFNYLNGAIGADTVNVERYIGDFVISISAGGDELYNYIQINSPSAGFSQTVPDYTNINGGFGVFSSRITLNKIVRLSARTQVDLYNKPWRFIQQ